MFNGAFSRKLSHLVALTGDDLVLLEKNLRHRRLIGAASDIRLNFQTVPQAYILNRGWTCTYKLLPDGGRQIVNFQLPGDFLGLSYAFSDTTHLSLVTITDVEVIILNEPEVMKLFFDSPTIAEALYRCAALDGAIVVEHMVNLGRRPADVRMAHLLLEFYERLKQVGGADAEGFDCPLTQYLLADALGLSAVHVNRVLRQLREAGLMRFHKGRVIFDDIEGLTRFAGFDPSYLRANAQVQYSINRSNKKLIDLFWPAAPNLARPH